MNNQQFAGSSPDVWVRSAQLVPFISNCYSSAMQQLGQAYAAGNPAAVLISQGTVGPELVIDSFVDKLDEDATVVRVQGPFTDAATCMRQIVQGIGFAPNRMGLQDLERVLDMFLVFQRSKKQRTILCFENSQSSDWWVLDKIRRLIELEASEKFGLLIIQSEIPGSYADPDHAILDTINPGHVQRIVLSPFTLSETRDFVRRRVETSEAGEFRVENLSQLFEFFAVTLIHEFSSGVPEFVEKLCSKCLRLMRDAGDTGVSTDTVRMAAQILGMEGTPPDDAPELSVSTTPEEATRPGRLVIHSPDNTVKEVALDQNCILIGRDGLCAVCVSGLKISRYHALVALSSHGVQLVDLDSTNGTSVNGDGIERCTLKDNDVISIGHIRIKYIAGGEQLAWTGNGSDVRDFEICDETTEPSISYVSPDAQLLRTT
ncbi:MAG: type II secretory pathway predicted ATPase ExeA [Woeseiaceae bacterium]